MLLPDQGALQEWGYVACTRARTETRLYVSEHDPIERETPVRVPEPAAPHGRAARALERSNAEPLALDQTTRRHDVHARLHARRQEELDRQRDRAADRLAASQRELKQFRWWTRRDRRFELEREIAFQQTVLRGLDETRAELGRTPPPRGRQMPGLGRDHEEPRRSLRPEPPGYRTVEREPPGLGLELEL